MWIIKENEIPVRVVTDESDELSPGQTRAAATGEEVEAAQALIAAAAAKAGRDVRRQAKFQQRSDPLFYKWQAGESAREEWLAERQRIREEEQ